MNAFKAFGCQNEWICQLSMGLNWTKGTMVLSHCGSFVSMFAGDCRAAFGAYGHWPLRAALLCARSGSKLRSLKVMGQNVNISSVDVNIAAPSQSGFCAASHQVYAEEILCDKTLHHLSGRPTFRVGSTESCFPSWFGDTIEEQSEAIHFLWQVLFQNQSVFSLFVWSRVQWMWLDCLHSTSHARHRTSPTFIFHPCPTNDRLCSASSRINSLCVSSTVTYCYQSEQNRCRYHCVQEFHTQFDWFVCKHGPKLLNVAQNQSAGKPPRQQMGHIILHVFPRRLLPQQLPQQSSQFACVRINFNISFDIHTTGYNRAICSCKPRGLAKTYKMNGGKQKKKNRTKWSGCVHQPALCNTPTFCWEVIVFCQMLDVYLFLSIYCACMFGFWARKKCIIL